MNYGFYVINYATVESVCNEIKLMAIKAPFAVLSTMLILYRPLTAQRLVELYRSSAMTGNCSSARRRFTAGLQRR